MGMENYSAFDYQDEPHKFSCSLNLPPANLEWSAFFFSLPLPSAQGASFRLHLGSSQGVVTQHLIKNFNNSKIMSQEMDTDLELSITSYNAQYEKVAKEKKFPDLCWHSGGEQ